MASEPRSVGWRQIAEHRAAVPVLVGTVVALLVVLAVTLPRAIAYGRLHRSHTELQDRLRSVERRMTEVDRILLRLRLYEAQLESLGEDPVPEPEPPSLPDIEAPAEPHRLDGAPQHATPTRVRPVADWAAGLQARVDTVVRLFADVEPGLSAFVGELESAVAPARALPSFWPAAGTLTSGFGWRRNPLGLGWRHHAGIDLNGDVGDLVWSASSGSVAEVADVPTYGRYVLIDHGFGVSTMYAHTSEILVKVGQRVERGQPVARMGNTGRSTGPHLHFEVRLDGHAVDPLDYLPDRRGWTPGWQAAPRD